MSTRQRRSTPLRTERRDEIREALLESIESLVAEGLPLADITVERMAAAAGISRAKFYVYFEDKADVLRAWFEGVSQQLRSTTTAWFAMDATSTRDDLRAAFLPMVTTYREHLTLVGAVHDTSLYDDRIRDEYDAFVAQHMDDLRRHILAGQEEGFIAGIPAAETAEWLALTAERMQRNVASVESPAELARHLDVYTDLVWQALYAGAPCRTRACR